MSVFSIQVNNLETTALTITKIYDAYDVSSSKKSFWSIYVLRIQQCKVKDYSCVNVWYNTVFKLSTVLPFLLSLKAFVQFADY